MRSLFLIFILLSSFSTFAQYPTGGRPPGAAGQNMNMGRFYGRILDAKINKGIEAASVQIVQSKIDSATKAKKESH